MVDPGQVLTGALFSEPMRVVTVAASGAGRWVLGLVWSLGIAWEFDPYFGLSISHVDPLPHQLSAVYDHLLKLARVRFLLADDAGAGKTVMAGLLIRELKLRGLAERIPHTVDFQIDGAESDLYRAVTRFVKRQSTRAAAQADSPRARAVGFLMALYQRRLASSTHALRQSLENRARRLDDRLKGWGFRVGFIHGGMHPGSRDEPGSRLYAEQQFRDGLIQVLVATEAAGEGINLQCCHILFNYDIPWNPNRLEQRMGRIHRYGQVRDCLIFNFVATNTIEGRVLQRLLEKLQAIRDALDDDAVFNVVGEVLPAAHVERVLRDYYAGRSSIRRTPSSRGAPPRACAPMSRTPTGACSRLPPAIPAAPLTGRPPRRTTSATRTS